MPLLVIIILRLVCALFAITLWGGVVEVLNEHAHLLAGELFAMSLVPIWGWFHITAPDRKWRRIVRDGFRKLPIEERTQIHLDWGSEQFSAAMLLTPPKRMLKFGSISLEHWGFIDLDDDEEPPF